MKVSLINPNLSGDLSILDMSLTYLATYLNERTPHKTETIDFTFHRNDWQRHLHKKMHQQMPDVVGIATTSLYLRYIRDISIEIKNRYKVLIALGGYHPSLEPDATINLPYVDAICLGDGEYAFEEYLNALQDGRSVEGIRGIWAKEMDRIVRNEKRELIYNFDELPIPNYDIWEDIADYVYFNGMMYFIGTRGCPFNCTYCSSYPMKQAIPGEHFRPCNPRSYAQEMKRQWERYKDVGMRIAHTFDPAFPVNKRWVYEFCDEYKKIGLAGELPFSCFARADIIDEERIRWMAEAGCKVIRIGIEAGNERIRNEVYEKRIPNSRYIEVIQCCHDYGITITGYNMLGGPGESRETMQETFDFVRRLRIDRPIFFTYRPLPRTRAKEKVLELGGNIDMEKWEFLDSLHSRSNIRTRDLTSRQIEIFRWKCLLHFSTLRILRLIIEQRHRFLLELVRYTARGLKKGVGLEYIIGYFLVSGGDNLTN